MEEDNKTAVAQAVERFDANIGTLMPAAAWVPPSFSSTPTNCDMISRIHVKARWLIRMLAWVRATLDDAEDMNITEESIRDWLRELQEVADAAEDLLDEFPLETLHLGFVGSGGCTAGSYIELPRQPKRTSAEVRRQRKRTSEMDQRMEDIVWRFMKIKKPEQALELDYCKEQTDAESIYARRTTSSVIEESHIVGRDEELAKIKLFLLSSDAEESRGSDVSVMAIVGMGGLGKTTLAQLAYSDAQVNQHFQLKSWVCVSKDFDVIRLTKAMLQSLNVEASGLSELDPLHQKLLQRLSGKERFLLVLDDVWEAENLNVHSWNLLTAPLRNRPADTKIIMTTRSRIVSEMVPRTLTHDLEFLSDEDTLELLMLHAFEGRDPNLYQNLVAIGEETAMKCGGVPLAAKILGGLLRTKDDEEWNKILESEVWNATINQEESIIPILRLSYRNLPAPLKRCFRHCSLFAKDYVFDRNQIIRMWMAQGYIKANRRELMEDIGQRYINNLLSRSFFQKYPSNPKRLQMHDLMHDLARCVSGAECYSMECDKPCIIPTPVQHLSILPTALPLWSIQWSRKYTPEPRSFRSFLLPGEDFKLSISDHELPSYSYTRMEHLRVLDLGGVRLDCLPESIARLKHLRYLRISNVDDELPDSVGSMYHLQTLDSRGVRELPNSMSNLLNLRHLILHNSDAIEYPLGIGKLTNLQTVPSFYASPKHNRAKLRELKDLNNIRGKFAIKGLENLADVNEAKTACLDKKRNITSLSLEWDPKADSWHSDQEVLESLKPSVKLASLKILGFKGPSYPSWLGDGSFSRLGTIKLEHCENWTFLPPLGHLPSLRSLNISQARAVEYIGSEFFAGGFPQLEELTLRQMSNWKSWCGAKIRECPKLKKLSITRCENLEFLSLINLGAVEDISISGCPRLRCKPSHSLELSHLPCVQTIKIQDIYQVGLINAAHFSPAAASEDQPCLELEDIGQEEAEYILGMCSHICKLTLKRCSNLTSLPLGFSMLTRRLTITECANLTSHAWTDSSFSRLGTIKLEHCEKWISLPPLGQLPSLKSLYISEARAVEYIGMEFFSGGFPQLEELTLEYLYKWKSWCGAHKEECRRLKKLSIECCENLECLSLINLDAVVDISISRCPKLRCMPGHSLELSHLPCVQKIKIQDIYQVGLIDAVHFSPAAPLEDQPCLQLEDVGRRETEYILGMWYHICRLTVKRSSTLSSLPFGFSHMICRLTITECANLASLPWTDLITLEYLRISDCPLFRLLDAKQLPPTLQVLCIYENPHHTEQCSNEEGGERNLYLVFRNVHDASAALRFCFMNFTEIHSLDIEWDCCTNDWPHLTDAVTKELLSKFYSLCISSKKIVIRGSENFLSKKLCTDFLHSRLSSISLLQCSTCEILLALSQLPFLEELYVGGASSLKSVVLDHLSSDDQMSKCERQARYTSIAFPRLQKLEFLDMPVWKEWVGTKEGDFPFLWKLVLKHCPRLKALPHLPLGLKELYLEDCEELRSLSSSSSQGLKSLKSLWRFSVTHCPTLDFTATEGPPPRLELMSLTGCPLLLAWFEEHPRMLECIPNIWVDGVQVSPKRRKVSI